MCRFQHAPVGTASNVPLGITTVPRPPYTPSALRDPGERIDADARLAERSTRRGALPRTDRSLPCRGVDPRDKGGLSTLLEPFPPRVCRHIDFNMIIHALTSR